MNSLELWGFPESGRILFRTRHEVRDYVWLAKWPRTPAMQLLFGVHLRVVACPKFDADRFSTALSTGRYVREFS